MLKIGLFVSGLFFTTVLYAASFTLNSSSFSDREKLASIYTCDGKDISPPFQWQHTPAATASFALILSDPDAPGGTFYHWVLFNIPRTTRTLAENASVFPAGTLAGKNSWGKSQYNGPCPPKGVSHHYVFSLYALDK